MNTESASPEKKAKAEFVYLNSTRSVIMKLTEEGYIKKPEQEKFMLEIINGFPYIDDGVKLIIKNGIESDYDYGVAQIMFDRLVNKYVEEGLKDDEHINYHNLWSLACGYADKLSKNKS